MQNSFNNSYFKSFLVFIFNFNRHFFTKGEPILLYLQQPRLVNNPGLDDNIKELKELCK